MHSSVAFMTLLKREIHRFLRLWKQTLVPPILTSILYILIFGYSLGSRIKELDGFSYLQFILPGLVMMGVINSSFAHTSSSVFLSKFQGNIQELLISPMSNISVVLALILGGMTRGILVGGLITSVSLIFTTIPLLHPWTVLFFVIFVSFIFSAAGFISALWATDFDKIMVFPTFLLTPLIYLGGVFYSISLLPGIWQQISLYNPMLYFINGIRYGFLGVTDVSLTMASVVIVIVALLLFASSHYLYRIGYKIKT